MTRPRRRRIGRRAGLLVLVAVTALAGAIIAWNWPYLRVFPAVLPGFTAKEYCSCRYVMEGDPDFCLRYTRQWLPIGWLREDEAARRITVRALLTTRSASWRGEREGCRLDG